MKRNRFASLLLTGKVATLPLLISQARADVTPSYQDVVVPFDATGQTNVLQVIELPFGSAAVKLQSIATDSNYAGGSSYAAFLCNNLTPPSTMNIAVAGVQPGDTVYLVAASNKNDPANLALDSRLTIGAQGLTILGSATMAPQSAGDLSSVRMTAMFATDTSKITNLAHGGAVYLQAVTIPPGASVANWRVSELDEIGVGTCTTTSYGTTIY